jgi:hypothetical protein
MPDKNLKGKKQDAAATKDLPPKPVDKSTTDQVKGGGIKRPLVEATKKTI